VRRNSAVERVRALALTLEEGNVLEHDKEGRHDAIEERIRAVVRHGLAEA
jgi:hypothetical protein